MKFFICNEEIIKHMEEDMTFKGLAERTKESYIYRVKRYIEFHIGEISTKKIDIFSKV